MDQHPIEPIRQGPSFRAGPATGHLLQEPVDEAEVALRDQHVDVAPGVALQLLAQSLRLQQHGLSRGPQATDAGGDGLVTGQQPRGDPAQPGHRLGQRAEVLHQGGNRFLQAPSQHQALPSGRVGRRSVYRLPQLADACPPRTDGLDDGKAEEVPEERQVQLLARRLRFVRHVERQDDVGPQLHHLGQQHEAALELVGIGHDDDHVGGSVQQLVASHPLFGRPGGEVVGSWQVDELHVQSAEPVPPDPALDGDPGVVAYVLVGAGERVEEGGLADVGVAGEGNPQAGGGDARRGFDGC